MKRFFGFALLIASLSVPAFAAKNSQNVTFTDAIRVGSTQLPAGDYKVTWTANDRTPRSRLRKRAEPP